jgi:uncharacterized membrane protein
LPYVTQSLFTLLFVWYCSERTRIKAPYINKEMNKLETEMLRVIGIDSVAMLLLTYSDLYPFLRGLMNLIIVLAQIYFFIAVYLVYKGIELKCTWIENFFKKRNAQYEEARKKAD